MNLIDELRRSRYINFVPEYLRENENFLVYFYLLTREFNINFENIKNFTDLVNPDKVPIKFIEALGSYFNFTYLPRATDEFNREALMRMNTIWEQRGTKESIIMAGTHGWNPGWVGGDIFIPGYEISKDRAILYKPRDFIFRHNISKFSGFHVYPDEYLYNVGIFLLELPYLDEDVRKRIYAVTQAGVKYVFQIALNFYPNPDIDPWDVGDYYELSFFKRMRPWPLTDYEKERWDRDTDIDFLYVIDMGIKEPRLDVLIHSLGNNGKQNHSGPYNLVFDVEQEYSIGTSMLPLKYLRDKFYLNGIDSVPVIGTDDKYIISPTGEILDKFDKKGTDNLHRKIDTYEESVEVFREVKLTAIRSHSSSNRSGNGKQNGIITGVQSIESRETPMMPDDVIYSVDEVLDLRYNDYRDPFYTSPHEFTKEEYVFYNQGI